MFPWTCSTRHASAIITAWMSAYLTRSSRWTLNRIYPFFYQVHVMIVADDCFFISSFAGLYYNRNYILLNKVKKQSFWFGHTSFFPSSCYYCTYWDIFHITSMHYVACDKKAKAFGAIDHKTGRLCDGSSTTRTRIARTRKTAEHLNNAVS